MSVEINELGLKMYLMEDLMIIQKNEKGDNLIKIYMTAAKAKPCHFCQNLTNITYML